MTQFEEGHFGALFVVALSCRFVVCYEIIGFVLLKVSSSAPSGAARTLSSRCVLCVCLCLCVCVVCVCVCWLLLIVSFVCVEQVPKKKPGRDEWGELFSFIDLKPHINVLPFLGTTCVFIVDLRLIPVLLFLSCEGICRDFRGLRHSCFCLVTELQKGPLKDYLKTLLEPPSASVSAIQKPRIPVDKSAVVTRVLLDMARGVAHLHECGIVHRDIALRCAP